MAAATWILLALGLLGAADIALFHTLAHGIRRNPESRQEVLVHAFRGPTYALLFLAVPNLAMEGGAFLALLVLLGFDLGISIWDFAIEGASRRSLGGLPAGEYVLHVLMAMLFGALAACILQDAADRVAIPTCLAFRPADVPDWLRGVLALMAAGVFVSGLQDALAVVRMGKKDASPPPP